ncbi:MAG: glycosyltransferase family 39 protein [Vicinamibacterales bacterium]|nr:glycosyltransferase family 39 protein [Vicinamibacterales bacterium]
MMPIRLPRPTRTAIANACLEAALVCVVCLGAYQVAFRQVDAVHQASLIDWEVRPAIMMACGYGFSEPAERTTVVSEFTTRARESVGCEEFAGAGTPGPAVSIANANRYSIYGAALAMRIGGVSWRTLDAYLSVLFALSMAFVYGLFRQATGRTVALAGVAALVCSPMLMEIASLRDFIKLPCFTALWLVLAWVIRRGLADGARATLLPMAVAGALIGIGIGLRMDALVLAPVFVLAVILGVPGFGRPDLLRKGAATALFVVAFLIAGNPILRSLSSGSNFPHFVVLGAMEPFDRGLSIDRAPYDVGALYADGFAWTVIASHGIYAQGARLPILLGSPEYDRVGMGLLRELGLQFPADVIARALGATQQLFRFPFDRRLREGVRWLPAFQDAPWSATVVEWRARALGFFEGREVAAALFVLALASAFHWRLGPIGLVLALLLCGYSMLQFSRRHMFHLDVIPIFMTILAVSLPVTLAVRLVVAFRQGRTEGWQAVRSHGRRMAIGLAVVLLLLAALGGTLRAAQAWQQASVSRLMTATLRAEWTPAAVHEESLAPFITRNGDPLATWQQLYHARPDLWRDATLLRVDGVVPLGEEPLGSGDLQQQYFRVILEPRCDARRVSIGLTYSGAIDSFDSRYTRVYQARVSDEGHTELLVPVYYHLGTNWTRFDGFGVPAAQRACVTQVLRARDPAALPMPVMSAVLEPGWQDRPLFQRLRQRPQVTAAGTAVDPHPDDPEVRRSGWRRDGVVPLAHEVPPLDTWGLGEHVTVTPTPSGFEVRGNDVPSGYQLVGPLIAVEPRQVLAIQIIGAVKTGEMCVGVLDGAQQRWLMSPTDARIGLLTDTADETHVRIVFSNCAHPPGTFEVRAVTYETFPREE